MSKCRLLLLTLAVAVGSTAMLGQEEKPKSDHQKHTLRLETDSGRYGVSSDKLDPKQLGVAIYPGAKVAKTENDGKGANLSLDWGRESMRLYVQKYVTPDSADQVLSFYRRQLAKYGAVLECRDGKPVAAVASELKCEDDKDHKGVELKAGSEKKQHIIGVTPQDGGTEFDIVYLEETKRGML